MQKWRADIESTKRHKQSAIAASIADPAQTPDAFEEVWGAALARESELISQPALAEKKSAPVVVPNAGLDAVDAKEKQADKADPLAVLASNGTSEGQ